MKTSGLDVQKLKKLFTALKKTVEKPKKAANGEFIETMVMAVLAENATESAAKSALKKIQSHFVDFNDLRVARVEEIVDVIGHDITDSEKCATRLTTLLNAIFQKYDCLTPEDLTAAGKKNTREIFEKFAGMSDFVCAYVMLTVFGAHAVPMNEKMIQYLKTYGVIYQETDNVHAVALIDKNVSAAEAYAFYSVVRHDSELANPKAAQILSVEKPKTVAAPKKPKVKK